MSASSVLDNNVFSKAQRQCTYSVVAAVAWMYPGWHYWIIRTWISERLLLLTKIWVRSLNCNSASELHINELCVLFNNVNQEMSIKGFLFIFYLIEISIKIASKIADKLMWSSLSCSLWIGYYSSNALKAVALQLFYIAHHSSYRDELPGTKSSRSG